MAAVRTTAVSTTTGVTTAAGMRPVSTGPAGRRPVGTRAAAVVVADPHERAPVAAVVGLLALLVLGSPLAGLVAGATTAPESSRPAPAPAGGSLHVVQPGESYWSIAEGVGRPGDLRPTVDALMAANDGRPLRAGDRLVVPVLE